MPKKQPPGAWEYSNVAEMQCYLSGDLSREDYLASRRERATWVQKVCRLTDSHRVFDLGSGEGIMAAIVATWASHVVCLDVSETFLQRASATCSGENTTFVLITGNYLDALPSEAFDSGYAFDVFIHLDIYEIYHYLVGVQRVLRPGGGVRVQCIWTRASHVATFSEIRQPIP